MKRPVPWKSIAFAAGILLMMAACPLSFWAHPPNAVPETTNPVATTKFISLDDPEIHWSDGWKITGSIEATPPEPVNPATTPSGTLRFAYQGDLLTLELDQGDYWGYLYVTVDGEPANLLPPSDGHEPSPLRPAGYIPLYRPESVGYEQEYVPVHRSGNPDSTHTVEISVWRAWGESPLREIIVDDPWPVRGPDWAISLALVAGFWLVVPLLWMAIKWIALLPGRSVRLRGWARSFLTQGSRTVWVVIGLTGFALVIVGVLASAWLLGVVGLAMLTFACLMRPSLWYAGLFFALPFYFAFPLPLLPNRSINLIDIGAWIGFAISLVYSLVVLTAHGAHTTRDETASMDAKEGDPNRSYTTMAYWTLILLAAIASWALVSATGAEYPSIALREWRTVFLAALVVAAGLTLTLHYSSRPVREVAWIVGGWLLGATVFAGLALWLYPDARVIIPAEGVQRLRGFYGSPNNLAIYLERTLAVTLALLLFLRDWRLRLATGLAALVQLAAFLLTFSKGGLFLALPAMGIVLWGAGYYALRRDGRSTRVLWALAGVAAVVVVATLPFLGTERFARIIDLSGGTGFLRVNLWRAAWEMAIDHPWLGVGPDGFLYAYRSQYIFPQAWMEPNLNHPHNWLLDWWTRLGIPGLLLGVTFWGVIVWNCVQNLRHKWSWTALNIGILAATAAALAHGLIDLTYALPDLMVVWALLATLSSIRIKSPNASSPS